MVKLNDVRDGIQRRADSVLREFQFVRDAAVDIARFGAQRLRRPRVSESQSDPVDAASEQIVFEAARRLIAVKDELGACIGDERHLVWLVEQEVAQAASWSSIDLAAKAAGDEDASSRARERQEAHVVHQRRNASLLSKQRADIERLKGTLHAFYHKYEDAKRARERLAVSRRALRAEQAADQHLRWLEQAIRLMDGLAGIDFDPACEARPDTR